MSRYVDASHVLAIQTAYKKLKPLIPALIRAMPDFEGAWHHVHQLATADADLQYTIANGEYYGRDSDYTIKDCSVCCSPESTQLSFNF